MSNTNDFMKLSDKVLAKALKNYADARKGEIANICYAASDRISSLSETIKRFKEDSEDDGK